MTLVHELGSVAAVIVGNGRKALTIVLSFILFPKPFSILYFFGVILVFGSVVLNVVLKEGKKNQQKHSCGGPSPDDCTNEDSKTKNEEYP